MSGFDVADEIADAFAEASAELSGDGLPLTAYIVRTQEIVDNSFFPPNRTEIVTAYPMAVLQSRYTIRDRQAGGAGPTDRRLSVAANTPVGPQDGDSIIVGAEESETYQIVHVEPFAPGGHPLYYIVQARR